ncbi:MAG: anthranilate synthase component I family protein [Flavobacteriales bacterium]
MQQRIRIKIPDAGKVDWTALRNEPHFLYRRVADQDRAVLGVGLSRAVEEPIFDPDNRATDWYFGALRYEWKDALEPALGHAAKIHEAAHCEWFVPRFVVEWQGKDVVMHVLPGEEADARAWAEVFFAPCLSAISDPPKEWLEQCDRTSYLVQVGVLMRHIQRGDIYELNYCTARTAHCPSFDPFASFGKLLVNSGAPYAGFHRSGNNFALCASPERFLRFEKDRVVGQPMKGTRPRSPDPMEDVRLRDELAADVKERSENVMALDVMRHDLSKVAASGSVHVEELCAVITVPRVHQMISTVSARLRDGNTPMDAVRAAFPMASMTGAPKVRAMQLIDEAEGAPRGLFSGSLGFFAPDGTGDLNVVIRTLLFDALTGNASIHTGSAITALCDPEQEWEECQLKARSVIDALGHA